MTSAVDARGVSRDDEDGEMDADDSPELPPEQLTAFLEWTQGYGDQDANGIDLSLLRENLRRSPAERLARLEAAAASLAALKHAARVQKNA